MAQFTAQCPHCKQQFNAQTDWIGQQANCPACGMLFTISGPTQPPRVMPEANQSFMAQCPHCKQQFDAQTDWIGQQANCPNCGTVFTIARSSEKKGFLEIIKKSKTLIPDVVVGVFFALFFAIYFIWLMAGFSKFNDELIRMMGHSIYSPWDLLRFNFPAQSARSPYAACFLGKEFVNIIDLSFLFLLGVCGCYLVRALLNRTIFRKIQIIASSTCLVLFLIGFMNDAGILGPRGKYDDNFSISYYFSTLFYVFILSLATIAVSVWMKYKLYLQECADGEDIGFMDFIKKFLRWDML